MTSRSQANSIESLPGLYVGGGGRLLVGHPVFLPHEFGRDPSNYLKMDVCHSICSANKAQRITALIGVGFSSICRHRQRPLGLSSGSALSWCSAGTCIAINTVQGRDDVLCRPAAELVVDRLRLPTRRDQTLVAQFRKVLRQRGLTDIHSFIYLSDGQLAIDEQTQDSKALSVRKHLQQSCRLVCILVHGIGIDRWAT